MHRRKQDPIRVLVVDDSALVRQTLTCILNSDPAIRVVDAAADPYIAANKLRGGAVDVITLDVEMPRMDGLTFLEKIMSQHPMPVVICSSLTEKGAETTLRALELGAVDVINKPRVGAKRFLEESQMRICDAVKAAAQAKTARRRAPSCSESSQSAEAIVPRPRAHRPINTTDKVVVAGASTGGTEAIRILLEALPADAPGMVVVQHMPESFTTAFAKRLNTTCAVTVCEAKNGDRVLRGHVLIAPGNQHTLLKRSGAVYHVEVRAGPLVCRHRPSVDVLFRSAAKWAGQNAVGVIMTGMGKDGSRGLLEMRNSGATTIAQDEATSVVYGMPKEAVELDAATCVLPLERIAHAILRACASK